jgi:hypothetical protein
MKLKIIITNKYLMRVLKIIIVIFISINANAIPIDLTNNDLYVKKGFSKNWINNFIIDDSWFKIPAVNTGKRSIRIKDLKIDGTDRTFLSFKKYDPKTYTYITSFTIKKEDLLNNNLLGIYLAQIGINWEIYLNGFLIKKEMHLDKNEIINKSRNMRDVVAYILPEYFIEGKNILAFKIVGDPTYQETGFYWNGQFYIDNYEKLLNKNSELIALILMFIYLIIGLYHLYLFTQRKTEKYNLFYGLFSIQLFIYLFSRSNIVYSVIF